MTGSTSNSLPAPGSSSTPLYDTKNEMSSTSSSIIPAASSTTNTLTDGFLPSSLSSPPPANRFLMAREGRENQGMLLLHPNGLSKYGPQKQDHASFFYPFC